MSEERRCGNCGHWGRANDQPHGACGAPYSDSIGQLIGFTGALPPLMREDEGEDCDLWTPPHLTKEETNVNEQQTGGNTKPGAFVAAMKFNALLIGSYAMEARLKAGDFGPWYDHEEIDLIIERLEQQHAADFAAVTQERDELRAFRDDVVTVWCDEYYCDADAGQIAESMATRAKKIRERNGA